MIHTCTILLALLAQAEGELPKVAPNGDCSALSIAVELEGFDRDRLWSLFRARCPELRELIEDRIDDDNSAWLRSDLEAALWALGGREAFRSDYAWGGGWKGWSLESAASLVVVTTDPGRLKSLLSVVTDEQEARSVLEAKDSEGVRLASAALCLATTPELAGLAAQHLVDRLLTTGQRPWGEGMELTSITRVNGERQPHLLNDERAPAFALGLLLERWGGYAALGLVERAREAGWDSPDGRLVLRALAVVPKFGAGWLGLIDAEDAKRYGLDASSYVRQLGRSAGFLDHASEYDAFPAKTRAVYGIAETGILFEHAAQEVVATVAGIEWSELDLAALDVIGRFGLADDSVRQALLAPLRRAAAGDGAFADRALFWFARWGGALDGVEARYESVLRVATNAGDGPRPWIPPFQQLSTERLDGLLAMARVESGGLGRVLYAVGAAGGLDVSVHPDIAHRCFELLEDGSAWRWRTAFRLGARGPVSIREDDEAEVIPFKLGVRLRHPGTTAEREQDLERLIRFLDGFDPIRGNFETSDPAFAAAAVLDQLQLSGEAAARWTARFLREADLSSPWSHEFLDYLGACPELFAGQSGGLAELRVNWEVLPLSMFEVVERWSVVEWVGASRLRAESGEVAALAAALSVAGPCPRDEALLRAVLREGSVRQRVDVLLAFEGVGLTDHPALLESVRAAGEEPGVVGLLAGHLLR